jgi:hypothetical protein
MPLMVESRQLGGEVPGESSEWKDTGPSMTSDRIKPVTRPMAAILWIGSSLVLLAGVELFVLTEHTDDYFAWTIEVPLTAAFLGAFYWTAFGLAIVSARQRYWARARVGLIGVQAFVWLSLAATLLHLDLFHFTSPDPLARGAAWIWLIVYALEPPALLLVYLRQIRQAGGDPELEAPIPKPYKTMLQVEAVVVTAVGIALFLAPDGTASLWPWALTPLTARTVAAWLIGLGLVLLSAGRERDWATLRPAVTSYIALAVLQFIALLRYPESVDWRSPGAWLYVAFLVVVLGTGLFGARGLARR